MSAAGEFDLFAEIDNVVDALNEKKKTEKAAKQAKANAAKISTATAAAAVAAAAAATSESGSGEDNDDDHEEDEDEEDEEDEDEDEEDEEEDEDDDDEDEEGSDEEDATSAVPMAAAAAAAPASGDMEKDDTSAQTTMMKKKKEQRAQINAAAVAEVVNASQHEKALTIKTSEIVDYMKASRTAFTTVLAALMLEASKKAFKERFDAMAVEAIKHHYKRHPMGADVRIVTFDMKNPDERACAVHSYICRATLPGEGVCLRPPTKVVNYKSADALLGYTNAAEIVEAREAGAFIPTAAEIREAKQSGATLPLRPFAEHPIPDEVARDTHVNPSAKELATLRARIVASRRAEAEANERRATAWKALTPAERARHTFNLSRRLVRLMLTEVPAARMLPYVPLRTDSEKQVDLDLLKRLFVMPIFYSVAKGDDKRNAFLLDKSLWQTFFSRQLIEAIVRQKKPFGDLFITERPAVDMLTFGHWLRERLAGQSVRANAAGAAEKQALKDNTVMLQMLLVTEDQVTNPLTLQAAIKRTFGFEPPLDWCRYRLSPLMEDAPKVNISRLQLSAVGKKKSGDGDDGDDDDAEDDDDAAAAAGQEEVAAPPPPRPAKAKKAAPATTTTTTTPVNDDDDAAAAAEEQPKARPPPKKKSKKVVAAPAKQPEVAPPVAAAPKPKRASKKKAAVSAAAAPEDNEAPLEARYADGLIFLEPAKVENGEFEPTPERRDTFVNAAAPLLRDVKLRTMDDAARNNSVPTYESHTTSAGVGDKAKKGAADGEINEDLEFAGGDSTTDNNAMPLDAAAAAAAGASFVLKKSDARFVDNLVKELALSKKRVEHQFVALAHPDIAKEIEDDWSVALDDNAADGIVSLALSAEERARFEEKIVALRRIAAAEAAAEAAAAATTAGAADASVEPTAAAAAAAAAAATKKTKKVGTGGHTVSRATLTMQSGRGTKPVGSQLTSVSVADATWANKPPTEYLDIKIETEPVDAQRRTLNYGQVLDIRARLLDGTATSEERLVALHTLTQFDVYMKKVLLARYEQRLMPSDVNPNNFMLVGRMFAAPESGFAAWLAKCDLFYYELRQLLPLINTTAAAAPAVVAAHKPTLPRDFSPLAGWANEPEPSKFLEKHRSLPEITAIDGGCSQALLAMRTKMTETLTRENE